MAFIFATWAFVSVGCASAATTHYVNPGESIQAVVTAADPCDTIIVRDGTYTENVDINKPLTIRSENGAANCIVLAANPWDPVFELRANYVNISGFNVRGSSEEKGIYLGSGANHCNISNNTALDNCFGIYLYYSENNTISNNIVFNNSQGILLYSSSSNTIFGNTALDNGDTGIYLSSSCNYNTISSNAVSGNIKGIWIYVSSNNNNISCNNVTNNDEDGILVETSSINTIRDNALSNNKYGIRLSFSNNNVISGNTASGNAKGIQLYNSCNYNNIISNTVTNTDNEGVSLFNSNNNAIYNNYFNNTKNAWDNGKNIWNITKTSGTNIIGGPWLGGNYWSDYSGEDTDLPPDGLGDTPYGILGGTNKDYMPLVVAPHIFDTGKGDYPSILGTHNGTITPFYDIVDITTFYTYPCPGTGGHTEYVRIWNSTDWNVTATWNGYTGDWHNLTFNYTFTLYANETYNYTIRTGSYPQIIHESSWNATGGVITCTEFVDINGKRHEGWIPAIKLY